LAANQSKPLKQWPLSGHYLTSNENLSKCLLQGISI